MRVWSAGNTIALQHHLRTKPEGWRRVAAIKHGHPTSRDGQHVVRSERLVASAATDAGQEFDGRHNPRKAEVDQLDRRAERAVSRTAPVSRPGRPDDRMGGWRCDNLQTSILRSRSKRGVARRTGCSRRRRDSASDDDDRPACDGSARWRREVRFRRDDGCERSRRGRHDRGGPCGSLTRWSGLAPADGC